MEISKETEPEELRQWYIFFEDKLLLEKRTNEEYGIPCGAEPPIELPAHHKIHEVTLTNGKIVRAVAIETPVPESEKWIMTGLRASYECLPLEEYQAAGKAYQILYWDEHSRYCPVCGTPMEQKSPIMKKCPKCGNEMYPAVSTAIIVLIRKGKEILLVHARNFRGTFYGLVAGFLEAGETLEQCVQREVLEETGLKVKNITYFGNQPWPYPSGLMIGFIADYESGEIKLQEDELSAGAFYSKENLPEIPRKLSIARKLIDWWLENN